MAVSPSTAGLAPTRMLLRAQGAVESFEATGKAPASPFWVEDVQIRMKTTAPQKHTQSLIEEAPAGTCLHKRARQGVSRQFNDGSTDVVTNREVPCGW